MKFSVKSYLINSIVVTIIFVAIMMIQSFIPFGDKTLLTIDLSQQYIDFFSSYKYSLTQAPEMILYSFQKGIGGENIGLWSYYLLSPFNLIFLFFNEGNFHYGVTIITYLKLLMAANFFYYFISQTYPISKLQGIIFSLMYTFMSYTMVYLLNIMWLDGIVLLPLIVTGLYRLIRGQGSLLYTLTLSFMMMINYYIGYMISLFLIFYTVYVIFESSKKVTLKDFFLKYGRFVAYSIIASLIAAIVLIPTLFSLTSNKGARYKFDFHWNIIHSLKDILAKLLLGSFNFDEMASSSPNIYVGIWTIFLNIQYFFNHKIKRSEKIISFGIVLIFLVTFYYQFFDLIWHGGQFPIWYDYRFSFLVSFFALILAVRSFSQSDQILTFKHAFICLMGTVLFIGYYYFQNYAYHTPIKFLITLAFALMIIFVWYLPTLKNSIRYLMLLILVICELTANASLVMEELNYVSAHKFEDYTQTLEKVISPFRPNKDEFYRIHKTFQRTKNDALYSHYNGLDHFSSTLEFQTSQLFGYLGLPDGSGFATYTHGTLFLDDFFGVRYLFHPTEDSDLYTPELGYQLKPKANDGDIDYHPIIHLEERLSIHKNEDAFPLGIEVKPAIKQAHFSKHQPIENQNLLINLINYLGEERNYYLKKELDLPELLNVSITDQEGSTFFTYQNNVHDTTDQEAILRHTLPLNNGQPHYLSIPSQISNSNAELRLNQDVIKFYSPFQSRQLLSLDHIDEDQATLDIRMKKEKLKSNLFSLYAFDLDAYQQMLNQLPRDRFQVTQFKHHSIQAIANIHQDQAYLLFTIPYDSGWKIEVDQQNIQPVSVLNDTLMAIPIQKGHHEVKLTYFPSHLLLAIVTSLFGIAMLMISQFKRD